MAPYQFFYNISDADGDVSRFTLDVDPTSVTLANMPAIAEAAWNIVNPLLNGHLESVGVTIEMDTSGYTNVVADVIADVQEGAEFVYNAVGGFLKRITLPTFIETFFTNSGAGKVVDTSAAAVVAFNTMMTAGILEGVTLHQPQTIHGEDLTSAKIGRQKFGKNRR